MALAAKRDGRWHLAGIASSYAHFIARSDPVLKRDDRPAGSVPDAGTLLAAARIIGGRPVDLVAIDMPLSRSPIVGRREADNAVSRAYGGRKKCGTHSPSAVRPGGISDNLRRGFEQAGYGLCTEAIVTPGLIEVYPHPALVELAGAAERLPYKAAKTASYWRGAPPSERRRRLLAQWQVIVALLDSRIEGVSDALPQLGHAPTGVDLKAYEDMIDAVVCAWIAVRALQGRALPYGDADASIWIPAPASPRPV